MASDGSSELEILITAVDEASEALDEISESMAGMAEAASDAAEETDESLGGVGTAAGTASSEISAAMLAQQQSFALAAEIATQSDEEIIDVMLQASVSAQAASDAIADANAREAASSDETAEEVSASTSLTKGSFMAVGVAAGIAFTAVASAVSNAISSAMQWDETSAVISQELKDIGSSIPLSAMQAYAAQIQSTTLFTQQQALSAEAVIAGQKDLAPQYQNLTLLAADLATKIQQFTGAATADLPSAMKILSNSLNDPVAGLSQLQRQAGIAIPAAMVTMIKNMANAGDTALADKELIAAVTNQVGGLATAAANAPGGGIVQLQNALASLGTYVGKDLVPALDSFAKSVEPIITEIAQWTQEHPKLTEAIIAGTVAFTALLAVMSVVGIIVAAVGSSVALAAVVISAAIASLIAIVVPNWKAFWDGFQDTVNVATLVVADIIESVLDIILNLVSAWTFAVTLPFNVLWSGLETQATEGFTVFKDIWSTSLTFIEDVWKSSWTDMSSFLSGIWTTIQNTVKTGVDYVISAINAFINALDAIHISIPSIAIPGTKLATPSINLGFSIPDIPMLAEGGFVNSPTLAIIGEAGPEAVVPLSSMGGGAGFGGSQIVINIQGGNYLDSQGATMIGNALAKQIVQQIRVRNYQP